MLKDYLSPTIKQIVLNSEDVCTVSSAQTFSGEGTHPDVFGGVWQQKGGN